MKVAAFFAGAGGLDLGFKLAKFDVTWANEYDKTIWSTYEENFPKTTLDRRSIVDVEAEDVPEVDGMIGGPPCQSWSEAGAARGIEDKRGQLFFEYVRLIESKKPLFFLAENVSGILFSKHSPALDRILSNFSQLGYNVSFGLLNAHDFGVPQDRQRVIIVGYQSHVGRFFTPPEPVNDANKKVLRDAISDLDGLEVPAREGNKANEKLHIPNHEYMIGGFSTMYMSRNRVRSWDEPSFTIQAGGRHAPLHPKAPKMVLVGKDQRVFEAGSENLYRRLSVREAARIQTFPDNHIFKYTSVVDGYKMIGNAVPVTFAKVLAQKIAKDLQGQVRNSGEFKPGQIFTFSELDPSGLPRN